MRKYFITFAKIFIKTNAKYEENNTISPDDA